MTIEDIIKAVPYKNEIEDCRCHDDECRWHATARWFEDSPEEVLEVYELEYKDWDLEDFFDEMVYTL